MSKISPIVSVSPALIASPYHVTNGLCSPLTSAQANSPSRPFVQSIASQPSVKVTENRFDDFSFSDNSDSLDDLDELFSILRTTATEYSGVQPGTAPMLVDNGPFSSSSTPTSMLSIPPPSSTPTQCTSGHDSPISRTIRPLPSRVNAERLQQSILTAFFPKVTREEAEKVRLATKSERIEVEKDRREGAQRMENLRAIGKKKRTREKERDKKRRYRLRKKARKVRCDKSKLSIYSSLILLRSLEYTKSISC